MKQARFFEDLQIIGKVALLYLLLYFWNFPPFIFGIFHAFLQLRFIELVINAWFNVELGLLSFKKHHVDL